MIQKYPYLQMVDDPKEDYENLSFWDNTTRVLKNELFNNKIKQEKELKLQYYLLYEIPDLSEYTWIEKLNLRGNKINKIDKNKFPPNLIDLDLSHNNLNRINKNDIPFKVKILNLSHNHINKFDGSEFPNIEVLDLSNNKLESLIAFPSKCRSIDISNNELENIPDFNEDLEIIDCSGNKLESLGKINKTLKMINLSENLFTELPYFHDNVEYLKCESCKLKRITQLPENLKILVLKNNVISEILCQFPKNLENIDLSDNMLVDVPEYPKNIQRIDISNNQILRLKNIPSSVVFLDCSNNYIINIPSELLTRKNLQIIYDNNLDNDNGINSNDELGFKLDTGEKFSTWMTEDSNNPKEITMNNYLLPPSPSHYNFPMNYDYQQQQQQYYHYLQTHMLQPYYNENYSSTHTNYKAKKDNPYYIINKKHIIV